MEQDKTLVTKSDLKTDLKLLQNDLEARLASKVDVNNLAAKIDKLGTLLTNIEVSLTDKVVMHDKEIENLKKRVTLLEAH